MKRALRITIKTIRILSIIFIVISMTQVLIFKWINPQKSSLMLLRELEAKKNGITTFSIDYRWVPYDKISNNLKKAILITEDHQFFKHHGIIPYHVKLAFSLYCKRDRSIPPIHGYSTITQQTAKNVFLYPNKTLLRKALEMYYSLLMELIWGKKRILEVYLNVIECGDGIFGVEAASMNFYKKPAILMSKQQSCMLAATLTSPRTSNAGDPSPYVLRRAEKIYSLFVRSKINIPN